MYNSRAISTADNSKKLVAEIKENILATLAYFDMFQYPLSSGEIFLFLRNKYEQDDFEWALHSLVDGLMVYRFGNFYSLKNNHSLIIRRTEGNCKAAELIKIADKVSNILIRFPYVRGIAISGSLSKNFADDNSDIDLFIITAKNRLWIARTLMHGFKKLTYLLNKQDYFCMNYYIDEAQLEIVEKNLYTAIEVVTLIPLHGDTTIERFYANNTWTREHLPNKIMRVSSAKPLRVSLFNRVFEQLFNTKIGDAIDDMLMRITASRWNKKTLQKKLNAKGNIMSMAAGKHFAKPDPKNFQTNLLAQYHTKLARIMEHTHHLMVH